MSEAVFHATDEVAQDVEKVATELEAPIEHIFPPVAEQVSDVAKVAGDVVRVVEHPADIAGDVSAASDAVKSTDDLVREMHADIAAIKEFVSRLSDEMSKVGPMGVLGALLKGAL